MTLKELDVFAPNLRDMVKAAQAFEGDTKSERNHVVAMIRQFFPRHAAALCSCTCPVLHAAVVHSRCRGKLCS